eukprot:SAG31_NODE_189_length_20842_cov_12.518151_18_plen_200_part_00
MARRLLLLVLSLCSMHVGGPPLARASNLGCSHAMMICDLDFIHRLNAIHCSKIWIHLNLAMGTWAWHGRKAQRARHLCKTARVSEVHKLGVRISRIPSMESMKRNCHMDCVCFKVCKGHSADGGNDRADELVQCQQWGKSNGPYARLRDGGREGESRFGAEEAPKLRNLVLDSALEQLMVDADALASSMNVITYDSGEP